jgi:hypothetical protein
MGYPPSPNQPYYGDGYGLTGQARDLHDQRGQYIAAGGDPRFFDAQAANTAHAFGIGSALDQGRAMVNQAAFERHMRSLPPPLQPQVSYPQPSTPQTSVASSARRRAIIAPLPTRRTAPWVRPVGIALMIISGPFVPAGFGYGGAAFLSVLFFVAGFILWLVHQLANRRKIRLVNLPSPKAKIERNTSE